MGDGSGDGTDKGIDLFDGVAETERKTNRGFGLLPGEADGGQHMTRFHRAGGTGGAARHGKTAQIERNHHGFAFDAGKANVGGVGDAGRVGAVDDGLRHLGQNALLKTVPQRGEVRAGKLAGGSESGARGHVFGTGPAPLFLPSAKLARQAVHSPANEKRAYPFRCVELVAGDGIEIDVLQVDGDPAGRLHTVRVKERAGVVRDPGDFFNRLYRAKFIVHMHDGHQSRIRPNGVLNGGGMHQTICIGFHQGETLGASTGGEDGRVLDIRSDDVATHAQDRQIVGFGPAGSENDLFRRASQKVRHLSAGAFQNLLGVLAGLVDTRGIPESVTEYGQHGVDHRWGDGRRRVVIEIIALHTFILPMASRSPLLTLTTDFGLSDHFVAAMKGVILGICPGAVIVDLTHELRAFDVTEAAFTFGESWRWFPKGTVHVAVVDPGVGSSRRPILVEAADQYFVGPDNGVLTTALSAKGAKARAITASKYFLSPISATFHGRDVFAPCAAHLAAGTRPAAFGKVVVDALRLAMGAPTQTSKRQWTGLILKVDRFGNLITNFNVREFPWLLTNPFVFTVGFEQIDAMASHYEQCAYGELYAIAGSSGYIEIVMREASAAKRLGVAAGAPVDMMGWAKDDA